MLIRQHRIGDVAISHAQAIQQVRFSSASILATCGHFNALAFCPTKPHLLASADAGGNVEVFDLHTGARIAQDNIESGQAWSLAYSPDSQWLIAGSEFGVIVIWELVE